MTVLDHLFVLVFTIFYPIAGLVGFRKLLARIKVGIAIDRLQLYRNTIFGHWALLLVGILTWASADRDWRLLGLAIEADASFLLAAVLTLAGITLLIAQLTQVTRADQETIDRFGNRFGRIALLVPHNGAELARFYGVSVTAGIVEEMLWRGYLMWYLLQFMPLWAAAVLSAAGFGLAHGYQGWDQVPRVTLVGAAFVVLYMLTGSVWLSVVLHIAVDVLQGRLAFEIASRRSASDQPASS